MSTNLSEEQQRVGTNINQLPTHLLSHRYAGLKVLGLVADNSACGFYRVVNPLHMLRLHGADIEYSSFHNLDAIMSKDIIIAPRQHSPDVYDMLRIAAWEGKLIIYEIDDDLDSIIPTSPAYLTYHKGSPELGMIPKYISMAHGMTTTTMEIGKWYYQYNRNIRILPNYIDFSFRNWAVDVSWTDQGIAMLDPRPIPRPEEYGDNIIIGYSAGSCYDDKTEVLTENGFKLFKDLNKNEKVASLNPKTNEIEYHIPSEYVSIPYDGELHIVENTTINYAVTPNHWMYISPFKDLGHKKLSFELKQSKDVFNTQFHVKRTANWSGTRQEKFVLPSIEVKGTLVPEKEFEMDDWLEFFGFWIAEGYVTKSNNLHHVGLVQIKYSEVLNRMREILKKYGYNVNEIKGGQEIRVCDKQLWSYLSQFGEAKDKYFPSELLQLDTSQLQRLFNYYMLGDGSHSEASHICAYTVSEKLANQLVEIGLKLGTYASIRNRGKRESIIQGRAIKGLSDGLEITFYRANGNKPKLEGVVKESDHKVIHYKGNVYCVTVPNHILYVKREGKSMWCGNTHMSDMEIVGPAIKGILSKYDNVKFVLYTSRELDAFFRNQYNLPDDKVISVPARHFLDHPEGLQGIDIQIAPILPCQFNLAKCVVGDTLVHTNKGSVRISDIHNGREPDTFYQLKTPLFVQCQDGLKQATHFYYAGKAETYKITTTRGYVLEGSSSHRIRNSKNEWVYLKDLKYGDRVKIAQPQLVDGAKTTLTKGANLALYLEWYRLLGAYKACGKLKGNQVQLSIPSSRSDVIVELQNSLRNIDIESTINKQVYKKRWTLTFEADNFTLYLLKSFDIENEDRLPEFLWSTPEPVSRMEFLRYFLDLVGNLHYNSPDISFPLKTALAREVQLMLLQYNIASIVTEDRLTIDASDVSILKFNLPSIKSQKIMLDISKGRVMYPSDLTQDMIISVEKGEAELFDISVPGPEEFYGGAFVNHNSPLKVMEGMASGSAVIASNVGPYARFHTDNPQSFLLVGKGQHCFSSWGSALSYLIENPDVLKGLQNNGRELIINKYALEHKYPLWPEAWMSIGQDVQRGNVGKPVEMYKKSDFSSFGQTRPIEQCPCGSGRLYSECCVDAFGVKNA